ncbi:excisionase [Pantoea vagans]|uniref:excisionase n=1 Tax=Pantoea vagans TaxID=470934 RepID=UPI003B75B6AE
MNLQEWASATYSQPPSLSTLRRWVREGRIYPCPELHGKEYKLEPDSVLAACQSLISLRAILLCFLSHMFSVESTAWRLHCDRY